MHGGVAMIDVNQFKSVNDSFGHLVGDEALQTVAAAMQSCLRQTDILIRYGGDEFLLLMPQNCPDGVESVIRRVQSAVQAARVPATRSSGFGKHWRRVQCAALDRGHPAGRCPDVLQ